MAVALDNRVSVGVALERARALGPYFSASTRADGPGWCPASALARPGGDVLSGQLGRIAGETGSTNGRVLAAFLLHRYAWRLAGPLAAVQLEADALPDLGPDAVWIEPDDDPIGVAFAGDWHACGTRFLADLTAHLAPLVAALREQLPLGTRTLWLIAADAFASAFVAAGELLDLEHEAVGRIRSLILDPPGSAFSGGTDFFTVAVRGRPHTVVRRGSCCQSFRVDGQSCSTCPRVPLVEQRRRVTDELSAETV